jgi:hypothetical protein
MPSFPFEDFFPKSPAYLELQPLRIPPGWSIGWNELRVTMDADRDGIGGSSVFTATNEGRRFNIDIAFSPEFDPEGAFYLTVIYQPWPRTERGRRRQDVAFAFDADAETVHEFETRSYPALIAALEHWIARCTIWTREGH